MDKDMPSADKRIRVSVIVPVYDVEQYLRRCLDSLVDQTFDEYEIIIINDCTRDNSQQIIDEYASKYPRIRTFINSDNLGLGLTRNRGIDEANGDYVMFVDSDDYVLDDYVKTYYDAIMEDDELDVVAGGYIHDVDGKLTKHIKKDCVWSVSTYTMAWAKIFRKSFLVDHNLYFAETKTGEDVLFSMEALCYGIKYRAIRYAGYYYFFNRTGITETVKVVRTQERFIAYLYDRLMKKHDMTKLSPETYHVIEYTYLAHMVSALVSYGKGAGKEEMMKKRRFVLEDAARRFPGYLKNPYIPLFAAKGQTFKIRVGVWGMINAHRMGMDKLLLLMLR